MVTQLSYWEKINFWFISTFQQDKVQEFLQKCYLNKEIVEIQEQFPYWYNEKLKALDSGFAIMLYHLLTKSYFFMTFLK